MVRSALDVLDAVPLQLRLELGAATPRGVLPALIGQDLPRRTVLGDAARERLQHQHTSLVMRHRKAHQVSGVIIQERGHIYAFVAAQQERKKIRLPQLVRLGSLKVLHDVLALDAPPGRLRRHSLTPQHPPHRRL